VGPRTCRNDVDRGKILPLGEVELRPLDRPARSQSLYRLCDALTASATHLAQFTDDTYICATEKHERLVLCKLQRGLTAVNSWCERWNIKISEGKTRVIYFSRRIPDSVLQLNGRDIPFVHNVTHLGVIFNRRMTSRHHGERTADKALRTNVLLLLLLLLLLLVERY
jgi:hypothetical protein